MTDLAKAIAFATHCLKWTPAHTYEDSCGPVVHSGDETVFHLNDASDLERVLQEFLGNRYFIQINRGTSSLFHWRVIVGWQDGTDRSKSLENGVGVGEDLWDAIFDGCVQAAHMVHTGS
jgi:hypothetical protein